VDACVFLIFYNKSQPEHQTKQGEIDSFRTILDFEKRIEQSRPTVCVHRFNLKD